MNNINGAEGLYQRIEALEETIRALEHRLYIVEMASVQMWPIARRYPVYGTDLERYAGAKITKKIHDEIMPVVRPVVSMESKE